MKPGVVCCCLKNFVRESDEMLGFSSWAVANVQF